MGDSCVARMAQLRRASLTDERVIKTAPAEGRSIQFSMTAPFGRGSFASRVLTAPFGRGS